MIKIIIIVVRISHVVAFASHSLAISWSSPAYQRGRESSQGHPAMTHLSIQGQWYRLLQQRMCKWISHALCLGNAWDVFSPLYWTNSLLQNHCFNVVGQELQMLTNASSQQNSARLCLEYPPLYWIGITWTMKSVVHVKHCWPKCCRFYWNSCQGDKLYFKQIEIEAAHHKTKEI